MPYGVSLESAMQSKYIFLSYFSVHPGNSSASKPPATPSKVLSGKSTGSKPSAPRLKDVTKPGSSSSNDPVENVLAVTDIYKPRTGESIAFSDRRGYVWGIMQRTKPGGKLNTALNTLTPTQLQQKAVRLVQSAVNMIPYDYDNIGKKVVHGRRPHRSFFGIQMRTRIYVVYPTDEILRAADGKVLVPEDVSTVQTHFKRIVSAVKSYKLFFVFY